MTAQGLGRRARLPVDRLRPGLRCTSCVAASARWLASSCCSRSTSSSTIPSRAIASAAAFCTPGFESSSARAASCFSAFRRPMSAIAVAALRRTGARGHRVTVSPSCGQDDQSTSRTRAAARTHHRYRRAPVGCNVARHPHRGGRGRLVRRHAAAQLSGAVNSTRSRWDGYSHTLRQCANLDARPLGRRPSLGLLALPLGLLALAVRVLLLQHTHRRALLLAPLVPPSRTDSAYRWRMRRELQPLCLGLVR